MIAAEYDSAFTKSLVGAEQRQVTRRLLGHFLSDKRGLNILEINCGTGEDAFWMGSKEHIVTATDISIEMIRQAEKKSNDSANPKFLQCDFHDLEIFFHPRQFDLIFSNFAGLNCASAAELEKISNQLNRLLKPGGHLSIVLFGKKTLWEFFIFLLKGKPSQAFRRWSNKKIMVRLKNDYFQDVYYHSVKRVRKIFAPLRLIEKKPVGLFIPPSYLEGLMKKHPRFFRWLIKMESKTSNLDFMSPFADHVWLLFKKNT